MLLRSRSVPAAVTIADGAAPMVGAWQLVELLGEGRWSRVYRARPREGGGPGQSDYVVKLARTEGSQGETAFDPDFDIDDSGLPHEKPALPKK